MGFRRSCPDSIRPPEAFLVNFDQSASPLSLHNDEKEVLPVGPKKPITEGGPANMTSDQLL